MFEYRSNVLAVLNQKGGVGKTTSVSVLAEYGALIWKIKEGGLNRPCRILVGDLDMQCNTSDYFVGMEPAKGVRGGQLPPIHPDFDGSEHVNERSTIADIFYGKMVLPHTVQLDSKDDDIEIDVIVGHPALLEDINEEFDRKTGEVDQKVVNRLGELLHDPDVASMYDLIILDTGPSRNPIFRAALRAATHVVVPWEPEEKSLQGVNAMAQAISSENLNRKRNHAPCKVVGLLPNKVRVGLTLHETNLAIVRNSLPSLSMPDGVYLPLSTEFPKRDVKGARPKSIFHLPPSKTARKKTEEVCEFVFKSIFSSSEVQGQKVNVVEEA